MAKNIKDLVKDVVASPLGEVIASVGEGVAAAQQALDEGSLAKTLEIYTEGGDEALKLLQEIGYRPTFYTLPETTGEVKVSLQLGNASQAGQSATQTTKNLRPNIGIKLARMGMNISPKPRMYASLVDAGYANRYNYRADVSARLTFKIVPVPPPEGADELRRLVNVVGKPLAQANRLLEQQGLEPIVKDVQGAVVENPAGEKIVATQLPAALEIVRIDDEIVLTLQS